MKVFLVISFSIFFLISACEHIDISANFIDTIPPTVEITYPGDNDTIGILEFIDVTADAIDNNEIDRVNFCIIKLDSISDSVIVNWDDYAAPFEYEGWYTSWDLNNKKCKIIATAYDQAENYCADSVTIIIVA